MQVRIPVMEYMDCKPHYQWLTLEKRTGKDRPTSGELHLRVQLRSDDQYLRLLGACNVQVSHTAWGPTAPCHRHAACSACSRYASCAHLPEVQGQHWLIARLVVCACRDVVGMWA